MSEEKKAPTFIALNLAGELSPEFRKVFDENACAIVSEEQLGDSPIDFLIVTGTEEFGVLNNKFEMVAKDIKMISISEVDDLYSFVVFNGKAIFNQSLLESEIGRVNIGKFFQQAGSVHIDEALGPLFPKQNSMKLINHVRLGYYGDTLAIDAFDHDFNVVSIRGYLYNIVYYLSYLKQSAIASVPIEIEYSFNEKYFIINIHANVENFVSEYMTDSFGEENTKDSLRYLLKSSYLLSDFFEITKVDNPSKVVFTAAWIKNSAEKVHYGLFSINNILTTNQLIDKVSFEVDQIKAQAQAQASGVEEVVDYSQKADELEDKKLPGSNIDKYSPENEESILYENPNLSGKIVEHVLGNWNQTDPKKPLHELDGTDLYKFMNGFQKEKEIQEKLNEQDVDHLLDRLRKNELTMSYEKAVENTRKELAEGDSLDYAEMMRKKLEEEISKRVGEGSELDYDEMRKQVRNTVEEVVDDHLEFFRTNKQVSEEAKNEILEKLQSRLNLDPKDIEDHIHKAVVKVKREEREFVEKKIDEDKNLDKKEGMEVKVGLSEREQVLLKKVETAEAQIEDLRKKLAAASVALKSNKQVEEDKKQIQEQAYAKAEEEVEKIQSKSKKQVEEVESKKEEILDAIKNGQVNDRTEEIQELIEKEAELLKQAKEQELELRKANIESNQKEALYEQKLKANERIIKAKDTAIEKAKESAKIAIERKDKVLKMNNQKMAQMQSDLAKLKNNNAEAKAKGLEREKIALNKSLDSYKDQVDKLRLKIKQMEKADNSKELEAKNRDYKRTVDKLEIQIESYKKEIEKLNSKKAENPAIDPAKVRAMQAEMVELKKQLAAAQIPNDETPVALAATDTPTTPEAKPTAGGGDSAELGKLRGELQEKNVLLKQMEQKLKVLEAKAKQAAPKEDKKTGAKDQKEINPEEFKRMKAHNDKLEKEKQKLGENLTAKIKEATEATIAYKKQKAENTAMANKMKMLEEENERLKQKTAQMLKAQQQAKTKKAS